MVILLHSGDDNTCTENAFQIAGKGREIKRESGEDDNISPVATTNKLTEPPPFQSADLKAVAAPVERAVRYI